MSRKLATIRTIREILPIDGADRIEIAKVDGWQSIVAKDLKFKVGDQAVYFECDSWLPDEPRYAFLKERCYRKNELGEGMRLKTMKLKKQLTQGLLMPMKDYPEIPCNADGKYNEDFDYTELLNVKLYEVPVSANLAGQVKGQFPSYITKTDEERCLSEEAELLTEDGIRTIKDVCENKYMGKVLGVNQETGKDEFKGITSHSIMNNNNDWYLIETKTGKKIKATSNEYVWLEVLGCYRRVDELVVGDSVKII